MAKPGGRVVRFDLSNSASEPEDDKGWDQESKPEGPEKASRSRDGGKVKAGGGEEVPPITAILEFIQEINHAKARDLTTWQQGYILGAFHANTGMLNFQRDMLSKMVRR